MKKKVRSSGLKSRRGQGFRARSKTKGGRKILASRRRSVKLKSFRQRKARITA